MGDGLLMLSWKNHGSTFSHVISSLREKDHYTDVTLACNGRFYPAHKIVLSACSQYFDEMLQNTPCKHPIIVLKDISPNELDALLNYMYAGEVSVSQNHLAALIKAAESLHIKGLAVPDELCASDVKESESCSAAASDRTKSPPAKRQRREANVSPRRECRTPVNRTPVSSPNLESENRHFSGESESLVSYSERENRLPPLGSENRSQLEAGLAAVKAEALSVPSSPVLQEKEIMGEHLDNQDNTHNNPRVTEERNKSSTNYQNQEVFEPIFEVKEEHVESDSERSRHDISSFSPPAASGATVSPTLSSATSVSPTVVATNSRSSMEGGNFEDHIRTILFNPHERRETLRNETGFLGPGPSGLLANIGLNVREDYRTGVEGYSAKAPEGYPPHVSAISSAHVPVAGPRLHQVMKGLDNQMVNQSKFSPSKKYQCTSCEYTCDRKSFLAKHIRIHTGEKPFACPVCPYRSSQRSNLKTHVASKHRDLPMQL